jgi:hypothetical protein
MTQENIEAILSQDNYAQVVDADEFYFQKAQDALNKWLKLEVSESAKSKLIELCRQYEKLKEFQSKDDEIKKIMELLFEIISYCDVNAKQKNTYNKYDDKRTLAKATVRMGSWIAGIIKLKFKHESINGASIINAFDFLLDPQNNTTVLSDNHRKEISNKLFNKIYDHNSFTDDLKKYYSAFNIEIKNNDNYSFLLSKLVYEISDDWNEDLVSKQNSSVEDSLKGSPIESLSEDKIIKILRALGQKELELYFDWFDRLNNKFSFFNKREKLTFTFSGNNLNLSIGSRYALVLVKPNRKKITYTYMLISTSAFGSKSGEFAGTTKAFFNRINYGDIDQIVWEDVELAIEKELARAKVSAYRHKNKPFVEQLFFDTKYRNTIMAKMYPGEFALKNQPNNMPLNQILFGPPGTGKTYNTINHAISIIDSINLSDIDKRFENRSSLKGRFESLLIDDWDNPRGQIGFATFHQSMSYEDFIEGIKPGVNDKGDVNYDVEPGIFKMMATIAKDNWMDAEKAIKEELSFEEALSKLKDDWQFDQEMKFPLKKIGFEYSIIGFSKTSIQFRKASGGTGHTFSISTLRDYYYGKREIMQSGLGIYYPALLDKLKSYHQTTAPTKQLKNYVLVIDEINRGNVSQIFGELITLIEDDKRLGKSEALELILPYSKEKFGIPPNLYIIGTMNTADRSVEALDTALRRRFSFIEMPPNYSIPQIDIDIDGVNLKSLLLIMNARIEKLLNKDHQIGHAYFIGINNIEDLKRVFKDKIIPLLQEYFYGDYGKIGLVLGKSFIHSDSDSNNSFVGFANYQYEDSSVVSDLMDRKVYSIASDENWDFQSIFN